MKVWDRAGIELATHGSAVRLASVARHVTDCAMRPGTRQMDIIMFVKSWCHKLVHKEGGGSVVEYSTQGVVGLGLTGGTALCP